MFQYARLARYGAAAVAFGLAMSASAASAQFTTAYPTPMVPGINGWKTIPLFTVGETLPSTDPRFPSGYMPPGVLDGIGAFRKDANTVRVLVNHELQHDRGYAYPVENGVGGTFTLTGARVSYIDIDRRTRKIVDAGLAIKRIYDSNGMQATSDAFTAENKKGLERLCSAQYVPANQFGLGRGIRDAMFFTGEETGGTFSKVGGAQWVLDPATGNLWAVPAMGRGSWENVTQIDTGTREFVGFIMGDDTAPFDPDADLAGDHIIPGQNLPQLGAPLYLYIGKKNPQSEDFLDRNGLKNGALYVWVALNGARDARTFTGKGARTAGVWKRVDNSPVVAEASESGPRRDPYGYPTQRLLWARADVRGAFQFTRPEDVATNPKNGREFVMASTGRSAVFAGAESVGRLYKGTVELNLAALYAASANGRFPDTAGRTTLSILYQGDSFLPGTPPLRSPDNLDWSDDGWIYVQEDPAFGAVFAPPAPEASIVRVHALTGVVERIAETDRSVVVPMGTTDSRPTSPAEWETSGILDVRKLFAPNRTLPFLLIDMQAATITDGPIAANGLVTGGQLLFLYKLPPASSEGSPEAIE